MTCDHLWMSIGVEELVCTKCGEYLNADPSNEDLYQELKSTRNALEEIARGYVEKHGMTPSDYARKFLDLPTLIKNE